LGAYRIPPEIGPLIPSRLGVLDWLQPSAALIPDP
jgi:hypothetical protein